MPMVNHQVWNAVGELVVDEWIDEPYEALGGHQVVAALNACLGVWNLEDAANVAGVSVDHLVAEVTAWGLFGGGR